MSLLLNVRFVAQCIFAIRLFEQLDAKKHTDQLVDVAEPKQLARHGKLARARKGAKCGRTLRNEKVHGRLSAVLSKGLVPN